LKANSVIINILSILDYTVHILMFSHFTTLDSVIHPSFPLKIADGFY